MSVFISQLAKKLRPKTQIYDIQPSRKFDASPSRLTYKTLNIGEKISENLEFDAWNFLKPYGDQNLNIN